MELLRDDTIGNNRIKLKKSHKDEGYFVQYFVRTSQGWAKMASEFLAHKYDAERFYEKELEEFTMKHLGTQGVDFEQVLDQLVMTAENDGDAHLMGKNVEWAVDKALQQQLEQFGKDLNRIRQIAIDKVRNSWFNDKE